jgi:hypothetical protein
MDDLLQTVLDYFAFKGWPSQANHEETMIRVAYKTQHGPWFLYARAIPDTRQILFYSVLPEKIAPERRLPVAEFLTRANFGLPAGNFEMDWEDGEIRFKTSITLGNTELTLSLIDALVTANLAITEDYLPGIQKVAISAQEPEQAFKDIRAGLDQIDLRFF